MTRETDAQGTGSAAGNGAGDDALMRELRLQRNLKILVGALGFAILAGLAAVAVRVVGLSTSGPKAAGPVTTTVSVPAGAAQNQIGLELPKGARVVSISVSGNRLAVHHESPAGTGIAIIDLDTGRRIADVMPQEALPRN
ncbi:MAG: hypothetical protein ABL907_13005 [Hyphomicrobium sp.]